MNEIVLARSDAAVSVRALHESDFEQAVAIDAAIVFRSRRAYFERRLEAASANPEQHVQLAAVQDGTLAGYLLARRMQGEFGRAEPGVRLETIGVRGGQQGRGVGTRLMAALERWAAAHGVREIRTSAHWRDDAMLRFLDHAGFELGDRVLDRPVGPDGVAPLERETGDEGGEGSDQRREANYGTQVLNDFTTLARDRVELCSLAPADLAGIESIDRSITGRDRGEYLARLVDEAVSGCGVRVSLVARRHGTIVGFLMARTDFGDFGRAEPIAVIDTIGVHRWFAGAGIGAALLSQLFLNLNALGVQRVETVVALENLDLLAFFHKAGFAASGRLAFVKPLNGGNRQ
ncbi:MAG TPA: GNAT family N-acetyltransferase [Burkholderiales bacterium]